MSSVSLNQSVANEQLNPEQVPSLEDKAGAVVACCGLPDPVAAIVAKYAMEKECFYREIFGFQQWISCWGATPVTLPSIEKLRDQVRHVVQSEGRQLYTQVEKMSGAECANFLKLRGEEENPEPSDELYEWLNRRVRPQDKAVAGFTCSVTYIPQYVRKDGRIFSVTARTLALDFGPHPTRREGRVAQLLFPGTAFDEILIPADANRTEPSCYFVMERDIASNTRGKKPSVLINELSIQGDQGWQLPVTRNFFATVFSRRAWKGEFLHGEKPVTFTYGQEKSRAGHFLGYGGFGADGLSVFGFYASGDDRCGASASRKFPPRDRSHA